MDDTLAQRIMTALKMRYPHAERILLDIDPKRGTIHASIVSAEIRLRLDEEKLKDRIPAAFTKGGDD